MQCESPLQMGNILRHENDLDEAMAAYRRALAVQS